MGSMFGADGIRGIVNVNLDCELAFRVGQAAAVLLRKKGVKPRVVVGMDTRVSSAMLENAITAGLCSCGADVIKLGVVPTPGAVFLTRSFEADACIMITASHEAYLYNGIRFFDAEGGRWSREQEAALEASVLEDQSPRTVTQGDIGSVTLAHEEVDTYLSHIAAAAGPVSRMRIAVDCANGAASYAAHRLLDRYPLDITWLNDMPDGTNINENCGSVNLWALASVVRTGEYDFGVAFDGDGDRCLAVDEKGRYVDGDQIMALCAMELARDERLPGDGFVCSAASNFGLREFAQEHGLRLVCASAGERSLLETMRKEGLVIGGEQNGHVIFLEHMPTGDGLLTALMLLSILSRTGSRFSELTSLITRYPQILINVPGPEEREEKRRFLENPILLEAVKRAEEELGGKGRALVRASGTEPLIRILVEGFSPSLAESVARKIAQIIEELTKKGNS